MRPGLEKLGIDYLSDSLNLNAAAQKRLLDHVFRYTLPESEVQSLPYDVFQVRARQQGTWISAHQQAHPACNVCSVSSSNMFCEQ
jgi:hypothetical protein